jgi:hypothetical protein
MPLFVAGLLFLDAHEASSLVEKPTGFLLWSLSLFVLAGEPVVFVWLWFGTRRQPGAGREPSYEWRVLFQDRIRERRRLPLQWPLRICFLAVLTAAAVMGQLGLAAALAGAICLTRLRHVWQDRAVAGALASIETDCAAGEAT